MRLERVVVIGTSAGGIDALRTLAAALPNGFPAPICVVMHTGPDSPGVLPGILSRAGPLRAERARDGLPLRPGTIYVAPPDFHLLLEPGVLRVTKGPKENGFRPAVDPLFRSAAQVYGPACIGVVLSGSLDDGTDGLWAIKKLGGVAIVQDPEDALFPSMPASARTHVAVDHVAPIREMGRLLSAITAGDLTSAVPATHMPLELEVEVRIAKEVNAMDAGLRGVAEPSAFACPDCHGVLLQLEENGRRRFRCHTGHAYTAESLLAAISSEIEGSLWAAVRALDEGSRLLEGMGEHVVAPPPGRRSEYANQAKEARDLSEMLRTWLRRADLLPTGGIQGDS